MQDEEAFLEASENGDLNAIKLLFSKFNNSLYLLTIKDRFGNNAFLNACSYGNMDCAIWLFDKGSSLTLTNNLGETAYSLAYKNKHIEICDWIKRCYEKSSSSTINKSDITEHNVSSSSAAASAAAVSNGGVADKDTSSIFNFNTGGYIFAYLESNFNKLNDKINQQTVTINTLTDIVKKQSEKIETLQTSLNSFIQS